MFIGFEIIYKKYVFYIAKYIVMKWKYILWIIICVMGMVGVNMAQEYVLFYGNGCPHCAEVEQYIQKNVIAQGIDIELKEIYFNRTNLGDLQVYLDKLDLDTHQIGVPFLVVNNTDECSYVNWAQAILRFFQAKLDMMLVVEDEHVICNTENCTWLSCEKQTLEEVKPVVKSILKSVDPVHSQKKENDYSLLTGELASWLFIWENDTSVDSWDVISWHVVSWTSNLSNNTSKWWFFAIMMPAALSDSINPCAFAVMLLLLTTILSRHQSRRKTLLSGWLFALAVFVSYLAMGLGIFSALASASNTFVLKLVVWILWILVWLANLKDYFRYGKWFVMEVPRRWRPKMQEIIHKVSSPLWAFFVWLIVSIFLLPCSSWPYFTILWFLSSQSKELHSRWFIYLIVYNLIFILPMLIISLLVGFGRASVDKLAKIKHNNTKLIHLIVGLLMLGLWLYVLLTI